MRHLTVYARFIVIVSVLSAVFVAVMAYQIWVVRNTVFEERQVKVLDMVETAKKILSYYDEKAKAGTLQPADARQLAFDAIGAMRWGQYGDYIGIYGAGALLGLIGFPEDAQPGQVDPAVLNNLVLVYVPALVVLFLVAIGFVSAYRIDRRTHEANLRRLAEAAP